MAHDHDILTIDPTLHSDLRKAAAVHPAAGLAGSPLAVALAGDTGDPGHIVNSTLTAYLSAIHTETNASDTEHQALVARASQAFPRR